MAFDAAHAANADGPRGGGSAGGAVGSDALNAVSQRVWTLVQTTSSIGNLSAGLGSSGDTGALRQRLAAQDAAGLKLKAEIEAALRRIRVELMSKGVDHVNQRALKRLEEQYAEVSAKFVEAVNASRLKRREFAPKEAPPGSGGGAAVADGASRPGLKRLASGGAQGSSGGAEPPGIVIEMTAFSEVDAALAEERADEALAVAQQSAALNRVMRDMHGLVHEQEEALQTVEAKVDSALEHTEKGVAELKQAEKYVHSYRMKWACVLLLVLIAVVVPLVLHFGFHTF